MAEKMTDGARVLLVPMHVDALVINQKITDTRLYNRWRMNYNLMNDFEGPMPPPFDNRKTEPPDPGVHLHWALPDGLTHGVENERGEIEFPFAPNRWLVVRMLPGGSGDSRDSHRAWVILSDELGTGCASAYLDPDPARSRPGQVVATRLGGSRKLEDWDGIMGEQGVTAVAPFLRAIGPGNVTFAAFAPAVENVFAFHDKLDGLPARQATRLSYLVVGWYSQPRTMDPLWRLPADAWQQRLLFNTGTHFQPDLDRGQVPDALLDVFQDQEIERPAGASVRTVEPDREWRIDAGNASYRVRREGDDLYFYDAEVTIAEHLEWAVRLKGTPPPRQTCVHGMVYGVEWDPGAPLVRPEGCPVGSDVHRQVRIAVGNTAIDALAALISAQAENTGLGQVHADLLQAFQ